MTEPLFSSDSDEIEKALAALQTVAKYPFEDEFDRQFLRELADEFPTVDLAWEIDKWRLWMVEHKSKKKVMYRVRLKTWVRRAASYQRGSSPGSRSTAQAESAEVHGATSSGLERW